MPVEIYEMVRFSLLCSFVYQFSLITDTALLPEDRDVADERKRVLECQPMVESMVGSPLILHELSKVCNPGLSGLVCMNWKIISLTYMWRMFSQSHEPLRIFTRHIFFFVCIYNTRELSNMTMCNI